MRTTVTLAADVAAAVKRMRRSEGLGVSEALNRLARAGLAGASRTPGRQHRPFRQRSARMGAFQLDVSNVGEALEIAEGAEHR